MNIPKDKLDKAFAWCRREYARRNAVTQSHCSHVAAEVMEDAETRFELGTCGVEGWSASMRSGVQYLNTGDSYGITILFRAFDASRGRWSVGAWGDIAERQR